MRSIRLGMVGGGEGAFIGAVHRMAARLDGRYQLLAMAPSSDPERARASGASLGLDPDRVYADYRAMARAERAREDGIEAVAIVTPNHLHHAVASAFMAEGIHVISDKPLTRTLDEALDLSNQARQSGILFGVTYTYSGYPMVRQAREMVRSGRLGQIRVVQVEYAQDWLARDLENSGQKQAAWRTKPELAGEGGCIGDIGTHAFHLAQFVSGLQTTQLLADLTSFVPGRRVDDNAHIQLRYAGGARGQLWASQVASGQQNALRLRLFGSDGGLVFDQESPECLWFTPLGGPTQRLVRGGSGLGETATHATRLPSGHPEGYLEAFAQLYREMADRIAQTPQAASALVPGIEEGVDGMRFVDAALRSHRAGSVWVPFMMDSPDKV